MTTAPDVIATMCPRSSTVATAGLLLVHTNTTFGIGCESDGPAMRQAVAVAVVSVPRIRIPRRVRLTCTDESRSVGYTQVVTVTEQNASAKAARPRLRRMRS